jgi:hypothetical protein
LLKVPSFEEEAMTKDHTQRQLAALVVTAFITATSAAIVAQTPAQNPVESAAVPAAAVSAPTSAPGKTVGPQFTPTPEQVADSLMGHQRYQAAIEEYKKSQPEVSHNLEQDGRGVPAHVQSGRGDQVLPGSSETRP